MSNLVLYFEREKILRTAFEEIFKNRGVEIHTEECCENKMYLVTDLKPTIIIVDALSLDEDSKVFLLAQDKIKIILTGFPRDLDRFDSVSWKKISKPLQVSGLYQEIFS